MFRFNRWSVRFPRRSTLHRPPPFALQGPCSKPMKRDFRGIPRQSERRTLQRKSKRHKHRSSSPILFCEPPPTCSMRSAPQALASIKLWIATGVMRGPSRPITRLSTRRRSSVTGVSTAPSHPMSGRSDRESRRPVESVVYSRRFRFLALNLASPSRCLILARDALRVVKRIKSHPAPLPR